MTLYEEVKLKLESHPDFRERSLRNKYLAVLAMRKSGFSKDAKINDSYKDYPLKCLEDLAEFAITFDSYRHAWGDVTRECKELRGKDYDDGEILSKKKQIELGYSPGYQKDIKTLKLL